ncbi:hypothetical protein Nepgr_011041 [Nepenthes gracilis]|uniref:Protein SAMBA n=1 Tax=Nepenthes gracilis TaxID=150966 RepID=A0AAD3SEC4_NEPGR|nr:hypothetical protein Nepgr_011041 [Nepenthes gracilis]
MSVISATSAAHPTMSTSTTTTATTTAALQGTTTSSSISSGNNAALSLEDFNFSCDLVSIQDRKDEALCVLKSDLMAALDKEVKSLDEDDWMFEGPRSRINLTSRPGSSFTMKNSQISKQWNLALPK